MDLFTVPLELTKEAAAEVTEAAVRATEGLAEFGKAGKEIVPEQISFGRVGMEGNAHQIRFGSLANGAFKADERYLQWKDGIDVGEITPSYIRELSNEIAAIYGEDKIKVSSVPGLDNAGMISKWRRLLYDPEYLRRNGNEYGMDKILCSLSHEVGHRVVYNLGLAKEISIYENEACADYIAGLTARLCKLNKDHQLSWFADCPAVSADGKHPGRSVRTEAFNRGYDRIDRGAEAFKLKTYEVFSAYDLEKVYQDPHMLKSILYQDVIAPLRTKEIKKI